MDLNRLVMPAHSFTPTLLPPPSRWRDVLVLPCFFNGFFITLLTLELVSIP
jgi:hypothetical protein